MFEDETHAARHDEAEDLRYRLDTARGVSAARSESLDELAALAHELRCQAADLCDNAHSSVPLPPRGLKVVTARLSDLADTMSRAAHGYVGISEDDMVFPAVVTTLGAHGWEAVPDRSLDGTLAPESMAERQARGSRSAGYRRGWTRGTESLTLWFTSPSSLRYASAAHVGRLFETSEVKAVVCSDPCAITGTRELPRSFRWPDDASFDASRGHVHTYLADQGWRRQAAYECDGNGQCRMNGRYRGSFWHHPAALDLRLYVWGRDDEPARIGYWAGPVRSMAQLRRLTRNRTTQSGGNQ